MRYIEAIKIVQLLNKGKRQLVDKEYELLLNTEYSIDNKNVNIPLLEYLRVLLKSLQHEYNTDAESDITYDLYLKLIQIVDADYTDDVAINTTMQFSNITDGVVTIIRSSAWGSIIGDITEQLDLVNTIATAINNIPPAPDAVWGTIDGTVTDQQDLVDYINAQIDAIPDVVIPPASRFAIEDNTNTVDRSINMGIKNLTIDNINTFLVKGGSWATSTSDYSYFQLEGSGYGLFTRNQNADYKASLRNYTNSGFLAYHKYGVNDSSITMDASPYGGDALGIIILKSLGTIKLESKKVQLHATNPDFVSTSPVLIPSPLSGGPSNKYLALTVNNTYADSLGNITLPAAGASSLQAVTDVGNETTNQIKIGTTVVNSNYKLLVGGGVDIESGALNMNEYNSYFYMSGGRCALIANGSGIQYRLSNNDETVFPDTSKSFIWRNKGFEHMKLYSDATSFQADGTTPATWEFRTKINYRLYLANEYASTVASTGAYKVLTRNTATNEVETISMPSRTLKDWYTNVSSAAGVNTVIFTYDVPANTLANDGDKLFFTLGGSYGFNANSKVMNISFAGTFFQLDAITSNASPWKLTGFLVRTSATTYSITFEINDNTGIGKVVTGTGSTTNYTAVRTFSMSANSAAAGDVIAKVGTLEYKIAAV